MTKKVFLIQSEGLGKGEEHLGLLLMATFLRVWEKVRRNRNQLFFGIPE